MQERIDTGSAVGAWATFRATGADHVTPEQFLPDWQNQSRAATPVDQMIAVLRGLQKRRKKKKA